MKAIRQRVRVLPGGRIEITDPALEALDPGVEADVVVLIPEPSGDGAEALPEAPPLDVPMPGGLPLVDETGTPVFLPPVTPRPGRSLVDLIGLRPSNRTAEEIDREIREGRGDDSDIR